MREKERKGKERKKEREEERKGKRKRERKGEKRRARKRKATWLPDSAAFCRLIMLETAWISHYLLAQPSYFISTIKIVLLLLEEGRWEASAEEALAKGHFLLTSCQMGRKKHDHWERNLVPKGREKRQRGLTRRVKCEVGFFWANPFHLLFQSSVSCWGSQRVKGFKCWCDLLK